MNTNEKIQAVVECALNNPDNTIVVFHAGMLEYGTLQWIYHAQMHDLIIQLCIKKGTNGWKLLFVGGDTFYFTNDDDLEDYILHHMPDVDKEETTNFMRSLFIPVEKKIAAFSTFKLTTKQKFCKLWMKLTGNTSMNHEVDIELEWKYKKNKVQVCFRKDTSNWYWTISEGGAHEVVTEEKVEAFISTHLPDDNTDVANYIRESFPAATMAEQTVQPTEQKETNMALTHPTQDKAVFDMKSMVLGLIALASKQPMQTGVKFVFTDNKLCWKGPYERTYSLSVIPNGDDWLYSWHDQSEWLSAEKVRDEMINSIVDLNTIMFLDMAALIVPDVVMKITPDRLTHALWFILNMNPLNKLMTTAAMAAQTTGILNSMPVYHMAAGITDATATLRQLVDAKARAEEADSVDES